MFSWGKWINESYGLIRLKGYVWDLFINGFAAGYIIPCGLRRILYQMCGCNYPVKSSIHAHCYLGSAKLLMGNGSYINKGCLLENTAAHINIGNYVSIGYNVSILTSNHDYKCPNKRGGNIIAQPVTIKDGCWICANSTILPGVLIEKGCVIAAGSVVSQNCSENTLYAGIPARAIKKMEEVR